MYVPYTFVLQYVQVDIALIKWSAPLEIDKIYEQQERNSKEMNTVHNILLSTKNNNNNSYNVTIVTKKYGNGLMSITR